MKMYIVPLERIGQVREGDTLLIFDGRDIVHAEAQRVKVSEHDGEEVIFNLRENKFFNVGMYLAGKSWAKDVRLVLARNFVFMCGEEAIPGQKWGTWAGYRQISREEWQRRGGADNSNLRAKASSKGWFTYWIKDPRCV